MTPVRCIAVPELADPVSHYSHATAANGFLFISGLLAVDADMPPRRPNIFSQPCG
jgi:enamine deaminase RidA (YjgF/YER057c/UK114 family)